MSDNMKVDIMDVLNTLYEHGYTPKQALNKIYSRLEQEVSDFSAQNEEDEEQITVKLNPLSNHEIPLKSSKEEYEFKVCLQKEGEVEKEKK